MIPFDVPVDPDAEQARQWLIEELAKPEYQAAQPSWFDRLSEAFWNWLNSLDLSGGGGAQAPLLAVLIIVIIAAAVTAFLIFGIPRLNRKAATPGALFEDDQRTAEELRAAAEDAAHSNDWPLAIEELFRAVALSLMERAIVHTTPGTTAVQFSLAAAAPFPQFADELSACAQLFDSVRYLDQPGSREGYDRLAQLDRGLRASTATIGAGA